MMVTTKQLEQLPLRAMVAFAARCAKRVRPLYRLPVDVKTSDRHQASVEAAIQVAEAFARGEERNSEAADVAASAVAAAGDADASTADASAVDAANAAASAAAAAYTAASIAVKDFTVNHAAEAYGFSVSASSAVSAAAEADIKTIIKLYSGEYDPIGFPIDPSESGPLGPLWPEGVPDPISKAMRSRTEDKAKADGSDDAELVIEIEAPENATDEELIALAGEAAHLADSYYRGIGGNGLKVERLEILEGAMVPAVTPNG